MDKELLEQANIARRVAMVLAENIYAHIGGVISHEELKNVVDQLVRGDRVELLYHKYILKDYIDDIYTHLDDNVIVDDENSFILIDD